MGKKYVEIIECGKFYHIYNHAVGDDLLFYEDRDYSYFMNLIEDLILPHANLWAYCLMPNHYHLILEIKDELKGNAAIVLSMAFKRLGIKFVHSINIRKGRRGTLFMRPFKRIKVDM